DPAALELDEVANIREPQVMTVGRAIGEMFKAGHVGLRIAGTRPGPRGPMELAIEGHRSSHGSLTRRRLLTVLPQQAIDAKPAGAWIGLLEPTFKGSECPSRFFVLRAPHTMSGRGPVRRSTAGDGAGHHRPAHPLDHLSGIGSRPLVQIRTTLPPPWGLRSGLCCQESAGHACAG